MRAEGVALDRAAGIAVGGESPVDAERAEGGLVEHGGGVDVEDEDGRLGGDGVELLGGGQARVVEELVRAEPPHHPHPLPQRRAGHLLAERPHGIRAARDAVPSELEGVVEPAADRVGVRVGQAGDDATVAGVDDLGGGAGERPDLGVGPDCDEASARDGEGPRLGARGVHRGHAGVAEDEFGGGPGAGGAPLGCGAPRQTAHGRGAGERGGRCEEVAPTDRKRHGWPRRAVMNGSDADGIPARARRQFEPADLAPCCAFHELKTLP
jgi:hypothetical protein